MKAWLYLNHRVESSKTDSVVISGHSLVIQSVAPRHSGNYSCVASNSQGDAVSQSLQLRVRFRPVCSQSDLQTVFLPLNVQAEVLCRVTAHPPPSFWWWTFNKFSMLYLCIPIDPNIYVDNWKIALPFYETELTRSTSSTLSQQSSHTTHHIDFLHCFSASLHPPPPAFPLQLPLPPNCQEMTHVTKFKYPPL